MDAKEMLEAFGGFDPSEHEDEARQRWGGTDAYRESACRTARYAREDWERIKAEGAAAVDALGLAEMYVADPRFARNYESVRPGLAAYFRDAIVAAVHSGRLA